MIALIPPVDDLAQRLSTVPGIHVRSGPDDWSLVVRRAQSPEVQISLTARQWILVDGPTTHTLYPQGMERLCALHVRWYLRTRDMDRPGDLPPVPPEPCGRPGCPETVVDKWVGCPRCDSGVTDG